MIRRNIYLLLLLAVAISCKKELPVTISAESFSEKELPACNFISCPEISINYITINGEGNRSKKINSAITNFIVAALYLGDEEIDPKARSISEAATQFIEMYRTHSAEFPDMQLEYFADINVVEAFSSTNLLSLEMHQYLFTGGAHGYGATQFHNFDAQTGLELSVEEIFTTLDTFKNFVEGKFKTAYEIPEGDSINSTGFWFDDGTFYLPETIGFTETSLILIYNQYDIASYAAGPVELEIPLGEVEPYLAIPIK